MSSVVRAVGAAILALSVLGPVRAEVTRDNFMVRSTADLVSLCDVVPQDPLRVQALHFCHGFFAGAVDYHLSIQLPGRTMGYCLPEQRPTRNQAVKMFVEWAKANPQTGPERPVDGLFRFAQATWPCKS